MPLLLGKLVIAVVMTSVTVGIAYALGSTMAAVSEADRKAAQDRQAA